MPNISPEAKAQVKEAVRHPIVWWRGAGLPDEKLRPWEGGIQMAAEGLKGFMDGFTGMRHLLYLGMGEGRIPPLWMTVHDWIRITWDALTDPPVGAYMDRRRYGERIHRWIMRFNATLSPLLILLQVFNFGLSPMQRIVQWTLIIMFADLMSTTNAVSESKIWAGITPLTDQRGVVQLCKTIGGQLGATFRGIPMGLMGLRSVLGVTDYFIMVFGASLFAPLTIFARWLPSFAKQRVDFTVKVKGEGNSGEAERPPSIRECFAIVKHNRWFMMWIVINIVRLLVPRTNFMYFYRFLVSPFHIRGFEITGELLHTIRGLTFAMPAFLMQPLALKIVGKFDNKVNFIRLHVLILILQHGITYFIGYHTWPRLLIIFTMEGFRECFDRWAPIPHGQINFEMLDYVEWKTGHRSEGMTMAVDGIFNKLIRGNVDSLVNNAVLQWTGFLGWDIPREEQPRRFLDSIWPLMHIIKAGGEVIVLAFLLWFKYPRDPYEVEEDLIERRALAQQAKEETNA